MVMAPHSLYGKKVGFELGSKRLVTGGLELVNEANYNDGWAPVSSPTTVALFHDFTTQALSEFTFTEGTDSATSVAVSTSGSGGILRLTTGDAGTGYAADAEQMTGPLAFRASNGNLVFQTRLTLSAITTCQVYLGFTDDNTTLEIPIDSAASADTITTTATNAVGFFFDTDMTTKNWWAAGVKADVDATAANTGLAPVAATFQTFRIEVDTTGNAIFYINGAKVATVLNAVTTSTILCPVITASKLSVAASMNVDVDYIAASMTR